MTGKICWSLKLAIGLLGIDILFPPCHQYLESCLLPWSCPPSPLQGGSIFCNSWNKKSSKLRFSFRRLDQTLRVWSYEYLNIKTCHRQAWQGWPLPSSCSTRGWGLHWPQVGDMMMWWTFNGVFLHFWGFCNFEIFILALFAGTSQVWTTWLHLGSSPRRSLPRTR